MLFRSKLGIPFVLLLGEDEIAQDRVSLKNMRSGVQSLLTLEEAAAAIAQSLAVSAAPVREPEQE